jgi:uncharacterized protein (TIGR02271 family)
MSNCGVGLAALLEERPPRRRILSKEAIMARTIVAMFDQRTDAERVKDELIKDGIPSSDIELGAPPAEGTAPHGFWERIREAFGMSDMAEYHEAERRGKVMLTAHVGDERADRVVGIMQAHRAIDIDRNAEEWSKAGWQRPVREEEGATTTKTAATKGGAKAVRGEEAETVIPVVEERLRVGTRPEKRGAVRVYTHVEEVPVEEEVQLRRERAVVERRPADRPAGAEAFKEKTIEVSELREEPVVSKEARVVEEVVVGKDVGVETQKVRDTVKKTHVEVEQLSDEDLRKDYDRSFSNRGITYDQFRPAYEYGHSLAREERFRGRDWNSIEAEARKTFEDRKLGRWDSMRDVVHRGYEGARAAGNAPSTKAGTMKEPGSTR